MDQFAEEILGEEMCERMSRWKEVIGSVRRINGLFHLLINGVYWGYNPLILTIDPNFLGHPSVGDFGAFTSLKMNGMEPNNHPIKKENHLPSTSIFWVQNVIPPGK